MKIKNLKFHGILPSSCQFQILKYGHSHQKEEEEEEEEEEERVFRPEEEEEPVDNQPVTEGLRRRRRTYFLWYACKVDSCSNPCCMAVKASFAFGWGFLSGCSASTMRLCVRERVGVCVCERECVCFSCRRIVLVCDTYMYVYV